MCNDDITEEFIACFSALDSNSSLLCSTLGGILSTSTEAADNSSLTCQTPPLSCEQFDSCSSCLSTDVAMEMGCVWCPCQARCSSSQTSTETAVTVTCPCPTINSTQPEVCFLDRCAIPSCSDCQSEEGCQWLSHRIREDPNTHNGILVSSEVREWGCYSDLIRNVILNQLRLDVAFGTCVPPCRTATSCSSCIGLLSPSAGSATCVWAEYSHECMSSDLVPLACSMGECGPILQECPSPCVSHDTCQRCLMDPSCVWLSTLASGIPRCVDLRDLESGVVNRTDDEVAVYYMCPHGVSCYQHCHGNSETCVQQGGLDGNTDSVSLK